MGTPRPRSGRPWLTACSNEKALWQKVLIAVGSVATAITAVAGLVVLVLPLFRPAPEAGASVTPAPVPAMSRSRGAVPAGDRSRAAASPSSRRRAARPTRW